MTKHLKKHIQAAATATGNGAAVSDIWTNHKGGADIEQAFIDARGFTNLGAEALDAEAEAVEATEAHRVAPEAKKPPLAAAAAKKNAAAKTARDKAEKAQAETKRFLEALDAAESEGKLPDPAIAEKAKTGSGAKKTKGKVKAKKKKEQEAAADEKAEAEKMNRLSRFMSQQRNQLVVVLVSTLVGLLLPAPLLHMAVIVAVIVAAIMVASWIMNGNAGKKAVGVHAVLVGTMFVWVFVAVPLMEWRSSGSDAGIIPSLTTAEPTRSSEEAAPTFDAMFVPYPTNTPSPTEEPDN